MPRYRDLDTLLDLNNTKYYREDGYWWKIEAWEVKVTNKKPYGVRYNLTLHDKSNKRIFGIDNTHAPPDDRKGFHAKIIAHDHIHRHAKDKGVTYKYTTAEQLLDDFFKHIDEVIEKLES